MSEMVGWVKIDGWWSLTSHKDWLLDGHRIKGEQMTKAWAALQWDKAWVDMGPSPAGNLGPYFKVPASYDGDELVHRLYPRISQKWWPVIRRAVFDVADTERESGERKWPRFRNDTAQEDDRWYATVLRGTQEPNNG